MNLIVKLPVFFVPIFLLSFPPTVSFSLSLLCPPTSPASPANSASSQLDLVKKEMLSQAEGLQAFLSGCHVLVQAQHSLAGSLPSTVPCAKTKEG